MPKKFILLWFGLVSLFALFSRSRIDTAQRCAFDGNRIVPVYQVDLLVDGKTSATFCCITCASQWPDAPPTAVWHVRDEVTGQVFDSTRAIFIENAIYTVRARQDKIHVFMHAKDALDSISRNGGNAIYHPLPIQPLHTGPGIAESG